MAITMDLEDSLSDSKIPKGSNKEEGRPLSAKSLPKPSNDNVDHIVSTEYIKQFRNWVTNERWLELKKLAENSMREHRVFTIKGGGFPAVRQALLDRGWVEKPDKIRSNPFTMEPRKLPSTRKDPFTRVERMILHKFLEHYSVDFLWTTKRDRYDWVLSNKDIIISRFCRSSFTSKEGLCASLTQMHWYTEPGVSFNRFPRCYNIYNVDSMEEFVDDFRVTACISLLKWLSISLNEVGETNLISCVGKVPFSALEFAMKRLEEYISFYSHKDIDENEDRTQHIWEHEWDLFLTHHYLLVHEKAKFLDEKLCNIRNMEKKGSRILQTMSKYWPQMSIDGVLNIWIVKPGNKCRGRGILLMNNIKDIVGLMNSPIPKQRYVVQKYIENPLVIYSTKFDIRQWFLITSCQPLTIWMYKDSYLRFSSQIFSLSNYHESVHLTNNAVQTKYKNQGERNKALPDENMWDCHSFKTYLRQIGKSDMWEDKIYPGMKQSLISTLLANQDNMDKRQNSFELYGADFMLTDDFVPWLIEINSSPDLAPTTSVTARLCPQCLEDVIKVVIDKKYNPDADTGMFELIYKQVVPKAPAYLGLNLSVNGKKLLKKCHKTDKRIEKVVTPLLPRKNREEETEKDILMPASYNGPVITDLLTWLHPYENTQQALPVAPILKQDNNTVQHALTVVKSGLLLKNNAKFKRKSSSRSRTAKKEKSRDPKVDPIPHHCCKIDPNLQRASTATGDYVFRKIRNVKPLNENKHLKDSDTDKSVGNKRCYIDPILWEKGTTTILKTNPSYQNIMKGQSLNVTPRFSYNVDFLTNKSLPEINNNKQKNANSDIPNEISAIGINIDRLKEIRGQNIILNDENKAYDFKYSPYRVLSSPVGIK